MLSDFVINTRVRIQELVTEITNQQFQQKLEQDFSLIAAFESNKEYSITGTLEVAEMSLVGISQQIIKKNEITVIAGKKTDAKMITHIIARYKDNSLFDIPYFREWFNFHSQDLPITKQYVYLLEYLRLLVLEFLLRNHPNEVIPS